MGVTALNSRTDQATGVCSDRFLPAVSEMSDRRRRADRFSAVAGQAMHATWRFRARGCPKSGESHRHELTLTSHCRIGGAASRARSDSWLQLERDLLSLTSLAGGHARLAGVVYFIFIGSLVLFFSLLSRRPFLSLPASLVPYPLVSPPPVRYPVRPRSLNGQRRTGTRSCARHECAGRQQRAQKQRK